MRAARSCVNPAQVQSTIAFARSSPVESSARWTAPQARKATSPFIVRPRGSCTTAAPRPIVAIVPLSWYGTASSPCRRRGGRCSPPPALPPGARPSRAAGSTSSVFVSVIQAMSPTGNTSGWPARLRSGSAAMRLPRWSSRPSVAGNRIRLQPRAPDERVGLEHLPGLERDAGRLDRLDDLAEEDVDAALLERLLGVLAEVLLEHPEEVRRGLDERDPRMLRRHVRVVLGEVVVVELGQRAGALHSGRPAADDDDVQRAVLGERLVLVRRLPLGEHVLLQADGVGERVHRERVLRRAGGAEEVDLGAEREHEVVVGQRLHLRELHFAAGRDRCR